MRDSKGRFVKGSSGNPKGRPRKGMSLTELLDDYLKSKRKGILAKDAFIQKLLQLAIDDGNIAAMKMIYDRMEGQALAKSRVSLEHREPLEFYVGHDEILDTRDIPFDERRRRVEEESGGVFSLYQDDEPEEEPSSDAK